MGYMYSTDVDETGIGHGLYILAEYEARHTSSDPYRSDAEFDELLEFRLLGDIFLTKFGFTCPRVPDPCQVPQPPAVGSPQLLNVFC